ncbi:MAG TPA: hypothetical protein VGB20_05525 [bacterium]
MDASGCERRAGRRPVWRAAALGLAAALGAAGCGGSRQVLAARAQPVLVRPAVPSWDLMLALEFDEGILVRMENHGSEPIHVLWEESAYIDVNRQSHPVIPDSVASVGRLSRAVLAPGTGLEERLRPVPGLTASRWDPVLSRGMPGRWWRPFDGEPPLRLGSAISPDHPALGREIGVMLVLQRNDEKRMILAGYQLAGLDAGAP